MIPPRHDLLCPRLGCDALCPSDDEDTIIGREAAENTLARRPDGKWPPGVSGNLYKPRRRRAALELIAAYTDGGRLLIERAHLMAGIPFGDLSAEQVRGAFSEKVQERALFRLIDFYFGKRVQVNGKVTGRIEHAAVPAHAPRPNLSKSKYTADELAVLEAARRLLPADTTEIERSITAGVEDAIVDAVEVDEE